MKKIIFLQLLFYLSLLAQDQDINQITGAGSETRGQEPRTELEQMRREIRELKRELQEIKGKKPDSKKDSDSVLNKLLDKDIQKEEEESNGQYIGTNRDFFMQIQTPDFKKSLMERYQWQLLFWTHGNYSNNSDLRKLDNTNITSVDQTDDKVYFAVGGIQFDNFFPVHPRVDLRFDIWRFGFFGGDQLGGRDSNNDIKQTTS
jgi:hypothetical protein